MLNMKDLREEFVVCGQKIGSIFGRKNAADNNVIVINEVKKKYDYLSNKRKVNYLKKEQKEEKKYE